jgi:hypothetical protein
MTRYVLSSKMAPEELKRAQLASGDYLDIDDDGFDHWLQARM